jgi:hypothetical protein
MDCPPKIALPFFSGLLASAHHKAGEIEEGNDRSLARVLRDVARPAEAHDVLAPFYGWFSHDKDARALLDELNKGAGKVEVAG